MKIFRNLLLILAAVFVFELTFTSWTESGEGGGFSYTRTTALNHVPQDNQADPSATIWNGHKTFFSRKNSSDYNLAENQDRLLCNFLFVLLLYPFILCILCIFLCILL